MAGIPTGTATASIRAMLVLCCALALSLIALAAPTYPPLSGRIVDQANVLDATTRAALLPKLQALEEKSGIQFVVATVASLEGGDIETYANQLFRTWKLGEAKNNNGVLLLVAPKERKVRIEVGYGLEGTLTDALSKIVIANAIAPRFKAGDFNGGITRGIEDVITILTTDASEWAKRPKVRNDDGGDTNDLVLMLFALMLIVFIIYVMHRSGPSKPAGRWVQRGKRTVFIPASTGSWTSPSSGGWSGGGSSWGGGGGGSDSGGFSGGGGSSGGGGASGEW